MQVALENTVTFFYNYCATSFERFKNVLGLRLEKESS